jgi:hypothetical protein
MRTLRIAAALLLLGAVPARAADDGPGWRKVATPEDRRRLRAWRDAWMAALPAARAGGGRSEIAAGGALFDPDRALGDAAPPPGNYRCRTFKLGSQAADGLAFVAYPWFRCWVDQEGAFAKVDGSQRPVGRIHPDTSGRAVFLGTLMLGDEQRPMRYGRDRERDLAGLVERVEPRRWRIVLPYPRFESLLDVLELVPESVGTTGGGTTAGVGATGGAGSGSSAGR